MKKTGIILVLTLAVAALLAPSAAQSQQDTRSVQVDTETIDAIIAALYGSISGPAGEARDWDRLRSLFLPSARLIPTQRTPDGAVRYRAMTVDEYITGSGAMLESMGFRESETARRLDQFGDVAHVFSTYKGFEEGNPDPVTSGINSIQLVFDGSRWWISSLAWSPERPDLPIPPEYSPNRGS